MYVTYVTYVTYVPLLKILDYQPDDERQVLSLLVGGQQYRVLVFFNTHLRLLRVLLHPNSATQNLFDEHYLELQEVGGAASSNRWWTLLCHSLEGTMNTEFDTVVPHGGAIEVEFKFSITPLTKQKLAALGAERKGSCQFTDIYFDTSSHVLMLEDHWLRKRDGKWQLKYTTGGQMGQTAGSDVYNELDTQDKILEHLRTPSAGNFHGLIQNSPQTLDQLITGGILIPVVEFSTTRETYTYRDTETGMVVCIDLDRASFGYAVGEVEMMVEGEEEVALAKEKTKAIAIQLGKELLASFPGFYRLQ